MEQITPAKPTNLALKLVLEILKLALAVVLIGIVYKSGNLDFSLIGKTASHSPFLWPAAIVLYSIGMGFYTWKWITLLNNYRPDNYPFWTLLRLNWIAAFFNNFLPGGVAGDVVKMAQFRKMKDIPVSPLIATFIVDRIYWTVAFITSFLLFGTFITKTTLITQFWWLSIVLTLAMFSFHLILPQEVALLKRFPKIFDIVKEIQFHKNKCLSLTLQSIGAQACMSTAFWILVKNESIPKMINWIESMALVPLGQLSLIIPITPSGAGVVHVAFQEVFKSIDISNGASLYNVFFVLHMGMCFLGVIPFLIKRN